MDISFMTNAGGDNNWSLDECARWAKEHDFDCVRLGDIGGAIDSDKILTEGPDEALETLKKYDLYHRHSRGLHYPRTVMFSTDLENGKHTLVLRTSESKSRPKAGHAMRILQFTVN